MQMRKGFKFMQIVLYIVGENVLLKLAFSAKFNKIKKRLKTLLWCIYEGCYLSS